jgi:hypothetical protein
MIQLVDGLIFGRQEALHCLLSAKTLAPPNGVTCRGMEGGERRAHAPRGAACVPSGRVRTAAHGCPSLVNFEMSGIAHLTKHLNGGVSKMSKSVERGDGTYDTRQGDGIRQKPDVTGLSAGDRFIGVTSSADAPFGTGTACFTCHDERFPIQTVFIRQAQAG